MSGEERMSGTHRQVGHDQVLMAVSIGDRRGENCNGLEEESKDVLCLLDGKSYSSPCTLSVRHASSVPRNLIHSLP